MEPGADPRTALDRILEVLGDAKDGDAAAADAGCGDLEAPLGAGHERELAPPGAGTP